MIKQYLRETLIIQYHILKTAKVSKLANHFFFRYRIRQLHSIIKRKENPEKSGFLKGYNLLISKQHSTAARHVGTHSVPQDRMCNLMAQKEGELVSIGYTIQKPSENKHLSVLYIKRVI